MAGIVYEFPFASCIQWFSKNTKKFAGNYTLYTLDFIQMTFVQV